MKTAKPSIDSVIQKIVKLLKKQHGKTEIREASFNGGDIEIVWNGARAIIKPAIGTHLVEFRTPSNHWGLEIGISRDEMPGAIIAGLQIVQRIPALQETIERSSPPRRCSHCHHRLATESNGLCGVCDFRGVKP